LGWLVAARAAETGPDTRTAVALVLGVGLVARALLLVPDVPLSDDLYRYLWDGRVANAGHNPFRWAPSDPALDELRDDEIWPRINHPTVPTIYPPVAQFVFRGIDRVAPTPLGTRATFAFFDLMAAALLVPVLRARRRSASLAVLYAWCPLAIQESAGGGHTDGLGVALLVAALGLRERAGPGRLREAGVGFFVALSACVKPVGVVLLPALLRATRSRRWVVLAAGAGTTLFLFVPYLDAGAMVARGFFTYAEHWRFNDLGYSMVVSVGLDPTAARWVLAATLAAVAIAAPFRWPDPLAAGGVAVGALLALSPTVHPWYIVWIVPFLPFLPRFARPAGFALVALAPVSYAAAWTLARTGEWAEPAWSRPVLWAPVMALLVIGLVRVTGSPSTPGDPGSFEH
jgi:hypothetical protein